MIILAKTSGGGGSSGGGGGGTWGSITGTLSSQTDLQNALDGKSSSSHTHTKLDITDLNEADYATSSHTHTKVDITDFNEADYATSSHTHTKVDITDFNEADYATGAEGDLATTALQSADIANFETTTQLNTRDTNNRDRANHTGTQLMSTISDAGTAATKNTGTSSGNIPVLDGGGKINSSVLPALAITETSVVASEGAQLALTVQEGDIAIRTDQNKTYIALNDTNTTMTDWQEILSPSSAVSSVLGRTGAVTAQSGDYDADEITETATNKIMTSDERTKLTNIETNADVTDTANVTSAGALMDSEVTDVAGIKSLVTSTLQVKPVEGAFVDGDKTKLNEIASGATANDTDVNLKNRANHTGTQTASTISDFDTEVANNSAVALNTIKVTNATHIGDVTGSETLTVADNVIDEANLKLDTAPTNDYVLTADSTASGGMKWAEAGGGGTTFVTNKFTTATTWAALDSLGEETFAQVSIDPSGMTGGKVTVSIDGVINKVIVSGDPNTAFIVAPSTDLDIQTTTLLATAGASTQQYTVTAQDTVPYGIEFNNAGTKMFMLGTVGRDINEYTLSVGWNLTSTVTFVDAFSVNAQTPSPICVKFNHDGTKMYVSSTTIIFQYTLSVGFDVSTASYASKSFSVTGQTTQSHGFAFGNSGTKLYITNSGGGTHDIFQYTLSTAWDISTASYDSVGILTTDSGESSPRGIDFSADGSQFVIIGPVLDKISFYNLNIPWDLSTARYSGDSQALGFQNMFGVCLAYDDSYIFAVDVASDQIERFPLSSAFAGTAFATVIHN